MKFPNKSVAHFRELGGMRTQDGRAIKHGLIFRSGELAGINDEELKILEDLGIQKVIDLRTIEEVKVRPDRRANFEYVSAPAFLERGSQQKYFARMQEDPEYYVKMDEGLYNYMRYTYAKSYDEVPHNQACVGEALKALDEHKTMLLHCYGGKDRTGMLCMIIAAALGCDYKTCKADYLLHNEITQEEREDFYKIARAQGFSDWGLKAVQFCWEACPDFFDNAWYTIHAGYASIEDYLYKEHGVIQEQIEDWKNYYLE